MEALDPFPPSDPVGEALHFLRMNGAFYCRSELTAPWGLTLPPMPGYIWFHVVTSGRLWLETGDDEEASWIQPGDLALAGTFVVEGEATGVVSEIGADTELAVHPYDPTRARSGPSRDELFAAIAATRPA